MGVFSVWVFVCASSRREDTENTDIESTDSTASIRGTEQSEHQNTASSGGIRSNHCENLQFS